MNQFQGILKHSLDRESRHYSLPLFHLKALDQLSACRTAKLGGHTQVCEEGHVNGVWYNSCKHRFCPQCNGINKERWILNTQRILLNCPHHHIVFTIASELNVYWQYNRVLMSDLLFKSVQETLKKFSNDKKYLGAQPGILLALHTWGRDLCLHPHIHTLVSHGGLNPSGEWVEPKKKHLFPQKPVMQVFRGLYLSKLKAAVESSELVLPPDISAGHALNQLNRLYRKEWVVHFCERYDHARGVAKYLGRYIKGGPFRLRQLKEAGVGLIKFQYKSHKTKRFESLMLGEQSFVRRMLEHVANPGKPTLRYGGLYVSSLRDSLNQARAQLGQEEIEVKIELGWEDYLGAKDCLPRCKECGKLLSHKQALGMEM